MKVAALYVEPRGVYSTPDLVPGVEIETWDEARDARTYAGPWPVVAHPPCARWCQLAGLVQARWGYRKGDDGGTFAAALAAVRQWGGVLEHPAYSHAWPAYSIPAPMRAGWISTMCGGWVAQVSQHHYGHNARKWTWLFYCGPNPPSLRWGPPVSRPSRVVGYAANRSPRTPAERQSKREGSATPPDFARLLVAAAASAPPVVDRFAPNW